MTEMVCATERHEQGKRLEAWWRSQEFLGFQTLGPASPHVWALRNCRTCGSTLARRCTREEMYMEAPDGYWISAEGYARLAEELEAEGHLEVAGHFFRRAQAAAVARFEEVCEAAEPPPPDETDLHADYEEAMHARAEAAAGR